MWLNIRGNTHALETIFFHWISNYKCRHLVQSHQFCLNKRSKVWFSNDCATDFRKYVKTLLCRISIWPVLSCSGLVLDYISRQYYESKLLYNTAVVCKMIFNDTTAPLKPIIWMQTLIKCHSSIQYASFDTFIARIVWLFTSQSTFEIPSE